MEISPAIADNVRGLTALKSKYGLPLLTSEFTLDALASAR
jgi:hypothetical protein